MNDIRYCQSCGMPMGESNEMYGTNFDGSKSEDYCKYCFANGEFTEDCTMEQMIESCVPHMVGANKNMSQEEARKIMKEFFPTLKRWNNI
ncbi:zinc ribbon domain-containing protein [Vallitalea maricola]|uniref:Zinc ribbon domain-containing protein n=1 Tax=Vallitalea maricola TaxID=3074433 RepID=A0ACB5UFW3_9FIRM|nr:zinc ribbon domain-containing protein [Vallitalea sp. AN17-2]